MSSPEPNELHLDLRFTERPNPLVRPLAIAAAVVIILGIFAVMSTDIAARILPMSDEYLQVLVPRAPDGKEPLSLKTLDHTSVENTLTVTGMIGNRTDFPIAGLLAVLSAQDLQGASQTVEVPLTPAEIPSQAASSFQASVTLPGPAATYQLKFRIPDGPFVAHHDDRAASYGLDKN